MIRDMQTADVLLANLQNTNTPDDKVHILSVMVPDPSNRGVLFRPTPPALQNQT